MAEVTSPIMTDDTGQSIATAITGLSGAISPAASNVTYDNTDSTLSASNVKAALDELDDEKVSKAGDTMMGDLTINKANGQLISKNPNFTINTSADNGVLSTQIEGVIVNDSADYTASRFISIENSNGNVSAQMACFNKKTDGTEVNNYINATVKKDGTREYSVADSSAFRSAIGVNSNFSYYNETIGTTPLTLPNNWKLLISQVVYNGVYLTTIFANSMMTAGGNSVSLGNYGTSYAIGQISKSEYRINSVNWAGSNVTASSKAFIYIAY